MKIIYENRYVEIGPLSEDYDFLKQELGNSKHLTNEKLIHFLNQLELEIEGLIQEGNLYMITPTFTRRKIIQFGEKSVVLNLNINAHKRAYFLFTIYELGHQCYEDGNALTIENND